MIKGPPLSLVDGTTVDENILWFTDFVDLGFHRWSHLKSAVPFPGMLARR